MQDFTHERDHHRHVLCAVPAGNLHRDLRDDGVPAGVTLNAVRAAFFRTLMRLKLRYTIYEGDVVVIERPRQPELVVDLSTGRVENAED